MKFIFLASFLLLAANTHASVSKESLITAVASIDSAKIQKDLAKTIKDFSLNSSLSKEQEVDYTVCPDSRDECYRFVTFSLEDKEKLQTITSVVLAYESVESFEKPGTVEIFEDLLYEDGKLDLNRYTFPAVKLALANLAKDYNPEIVAKYRVAFHPFNIRVVNAGSIGQRENLGSDNDDHWEYSNRDLVSFVEGYDSRVTAIMQSYTYLVRTYWINDKLEKSDVTAIELPDFLKGN